MIGEVHSIVNVWARYPAGRIEMKNVPWQVPYARIPERLAEERTTMSLRVVHPFTASMPLHPNFDTPCKLFALDMAAQRMPDLWKRHPNAGWRRRSMAEYRECH